MPRPYTVAVRELCDFAARTGDLDHRFTPSPSAQDGIAGHRIVAAHRGPTWRGEVSVLGEHKHLIVRGRADGFDQQAGLLEEIKTYRGDLAKMPRNHRALHWAQAKVYGALICAKLALPSLRVVLVYYEIDRQEETRMEEVLEAAHLQRFFQNLCETFLLWATQEAAHRLDRDTALGELKFPYASFRDGQRVLAENVFRAARLRRCLMVQAPTGIGKTIATIFPALKACSSEGLDKVFFLTAKGSGQRTAVNALQALRTDRSLRIIELVSRDKSCEHPDKACHGDSCPLARGFYDRLPAARQAAVTRECTNPQAIRAVAREHHVCPYYLTQELVRWSDVVIGDYNYYFDTSAVLHAMTLAAEWKVAVLVDEAHNLVDRARSMYSGELSAATLDDALRTAPRHLQPALTRLVQAFAALAREHPQPYAMLVETPKPFVARLQEVTGAVTTHLAETSGEVEPGLLQFYFDALHFLRLVDSFAPHSMVDLTSGSDTGALTLTLQIRNLVPATFLARRYAAAVTTVMFSATLAPHQFYADILGLPKDVAWLDIESPFGSDQLQVKVITNLSTRLRDRGRSMTAVADVIAAHFGERPGNYLAFFSSFDYLEQVSNVFGVTHPEVACWTQPRMFGLPEQQTFLERFTLGGTGIGFAVLGGSLAEGIDLPGSRLVGAFVITLGLPEMNPVNEEMRRRFQTMFGSGYEYAYLFPGLRKVVQAAGRVIRTTTDRGTLHLIDDRYRRPEVRALLPKWWDLQVQHGDQAARG